MRSLRVFLAVLLSLAFVSMFFACGSGGGGSGGGNGKGNTAPVADAGPDQSVLTGMEAILDGSASSDAEDDTLTYNWSITNAPPGSIVNTSSLSDPSVVDPTFTPDLDGEYTIGLVVNDGKKDSTEDTVTLTASTNSVPLADAGPDRNISTGVETALDGSASSDADLNLLTYSWSVTSVPGGSVVNTSSLSDPSVVDPTFTPDLDGEYIVSLVVNDGVVNSTADTVTLTAHTPGDLDASFGTAGIVNTDISGPSGPDYGHALAIDALGNIVAAGETYDGSDHDFALVRYTPDGAPDSFFGTDGIVTTDVSGEHDYANGVAIQPDGKIVAAGYVLIYNPITFNYTSDFALARYNTDGSLDTSFGTNGIVTTDISGADSDDIAHAVAIDALGNIVAAGQSYAGAPSDFTLVRYTADGTPDNDFGTNGIVTTDISSSTDRAYALTLQPDGKLVAVGYSNDNFAVIRYLPDGTPDGSFGTGGKVTTNLGGPFSSDSALAVALQSDGKIVTAGYGLGGDFALVRYTADGTPDSTFDSDGIVITDLPGQSIIHAVAVQPDGKILAAGYDNYSGYCQFAMVRYDTGGTPDSSFGSDGVVMTDISGTGSSCDVGAVALESDGRIVLAGYFLNGSNYDFALVRYWP